MFGAWDNSFQVTLASTRWVVAAALALSEALLVGAVAGYILVRVGRFRRDMSALLVAGWGLVTAAVLVALSLAYSGDLSSYQPLSDFTALLGGTGLPAYFHGNPDLAAAAALIVTYEIGLFGASGIESARFRGLPASVGGNPVTTKGPPLQGRGSTVGRGWAAEPALPNGSGQHLVTASQEVFLSPDEKEIMEMFLFNGVKKLRPRVDLRKPDGFSFQDVPGADWETARYVRALESLSRKGVLRAELVERLPICRSCGSAALQLSSGCPECRSVNLTKHQVVEHFVCGLVEKQEAFKSKDGTLECPKCHRVLNMVGSDYRNLSPMYVCHDCNAMNKDLLQVMKCSSCGSTSPVEEEAERPLYAYEANEDAASLVRPLVKPIEALTTHFKLKGYTVVAPAVIVGKSGAKHTFDLAVMAPRAGESPSPSVSSAGTAIEIMVSATPAAVEEIAAVVGKVNDVECACMVFAVPGLTENARTFASSRSLKIYEGKTIGEALAKSDASPLRLEAGQGSARGRSPG